MRTVTHSETFTGHPVSYDETDHQWYSSSNMANGYTDSSSTTYATIYDTRGANAQTWVYFEFDTSSIPDGATIKSVSCTAKCVMSGNASGTPTKQMQLYSGTTAKGSAFTDLGTSTAIRTLTVGSWTLAELRNARIWLNAIRGTSNTTTNYYIRFYGAILTVKYSYDEVFYEVTGSSNSSSISFSGDGEFSSGDSTTLTITGDLTDAIVTDNGVDVTSLLSGSGTTHTYTISGITADHAIVVTVPSTGQEIFIKQNGSWVAVDTLYVKQNGVWKEVETMYIKQNGSWAN